MPNRHEYKCCNCCSYTMSGQFITDKRARDKWWCLECIEGLKQKHAFWNGEEYEQADLFEIFSNQGC